MLMNLILQGNNTGLILGLIFGGIALFTIFLIIVAVKLQKKQKDREQQI